MPDYYCPHCKEPVEEDDARYDLYCDAVYYPSDCAHPAEYIGPLCPVCGEEMSEYTCDICGKPGMPVDEVLAEDGKYLICHECKAKMIFLSGKPIEEIKKEIYDVLVEKFEFKPDKFTEGYIEDLLEEFQNILVELKRLKLMGKPAIPLSEIRKHNPYIQQIGDQYSHRIEYHGIEFVQTLQPTERGYIYESKRPFEKVSVEFYND
jgi:DNA-directed RNA polymerase subunit RPC12/RpoP